MHADILLNVNVINHIFRIHSGITIYLGIFYNFFHFIFITSIKLISNIHIINHILVDILLLLFLNLNILSKFMKDKNSYFVFFRLMKKKKN